VDDAVAFQVIDSLDGNSARVDYIGNLSGVVRPFLKWKTEFSPYGKEIPQDTMKGEGKSQDHS
jgi:hypothetical protein